MTVWLRTKKYNIWLLASYWGCLHNFNCLTWLDKKQFCILYVNLCRETRLFDTKIKKSNQPFPGTCRQLKDPILFHFVLFSLTSSCCRPSCGWTKGYPKRVRKQKRTDMLQNLISFLHLSQLYHLTTELHLSQ